MTGERIQLEEELARISIQFRALHPKDRPAFLADLVKAVDQLEQKHKPTPFRKTEGNK